MKIVDYETFIRMPSGTIFAPYTPCALIGRLSIKIDEGHFNNNVHTFNGVMELTPWLGDNCTLFKIGDEMGASFEIYDGDNNDYSDYEMFVVFDWNDVDKLIQVLEWAKGGCKKDINL